MKISTRWLKYFLFISVALLLIGSLRYIAQNFIGLGPLPSRSAFAGRLPSVKGSPGIFQFFYATNRINNDETFLGRGNQLGQKISTGTFEVAVTPGLEIKPFAWFNKDSMSWNSQKTISYEQFIPSLREAIQTSPHKSVLILVWGFRDWFQSAALKTAYTAYVLDIDTPVLLFDWPGNQGEGIRGYRAAQKASSLSASDLGFVLNEVIQKTGAENIWLMGSSLGCQTICDALLWLGDQPHLLQGNHKIAHVVLNAPDVSAQAFNDKFAKHIQTLSKHLTAYVSSNDRALLMSQWLNGNRRLGRFEEVSIPPEMRTSEYEFEEALELLQLQSKGIRNIHVVDATPINQTRNLHHFFTDSAGFFDDLYQRLLRPDAIVNRRLHSIHLSPQGSEYWILWND